MQCQDAVRCLPTARPPAAAGAAGASMLGTLLVHTPNAAAAAATAAAGAGTSASKAPLLLRTRNRCCCRWCRRRPLDHEQFVEKVHAAYGGCHFKVAGQGSCVEATNALLAQYRAQTVKGTAVQDGPTRQALHLQAAPHHLQRHGEGHHTGSAARADDASKVGRRGGTPMEVTVHAREHLIGSEACGRGRHMVAARLRLGLRVAGPAHIRGHFMQ